MPPVKAVAPHPPIPLKLKVGFLAIRLSKAHNAIVSGVIVLMLVLIPAIMTALGVVKEK